MKVLDGEGDGDSEAVSDAEAVSVADSEGDADACNRRARLACAHSVGTDSSSSHWDTTLSRVPSDDSHVEGKVAVDAVTPTGVPDRRSSHRAGLANAVTHTSSPHRPFTDGVSTAHVLASSSRTEASAQEGAGRHRAAGGHVGTAAAADPKGSGGATCPETACSNTRTQRFTPVHRTVSGDGVRTRRSQGRHGVCAAVTH